MPKGSKYLDACHVSCGSSDEILWVRVHKGQNCMFDVNHFKRTVKDWIRTNPQGSMVDLRDYCDEIVPVQLYAANQWLIDQTLSWYHHVLERRELEVSGDVDDSED